MWISSQDLCGKMTCFGSRVRLLKITVGLATVRVSRPMSDTGFINSCGSRQDDRYYVFTFGLVNQP